MSRLREHFSWYLPEYFVIGALLVAALVLGITAAVLA